MRNSIEYTKLWILLALKSNSDAYNQDDLNITINDIDIPFPQTFHAELIRGRSKVGLVIRETCIHLIFEKVLEREWN